jgi:uncharacterized protein
MMDRPHLPRLAPIDLYGNGGFRFADMSHRGSLLCLPSGIYAWNVAHVDEIDEAAIAGLIAEASEIDMLFIGTGDVAAQLKSPVRKRLREAGIGTEVMLTGAAIRIYNIVLGERRRVAAALIAVA